MEEKEQEEEKKKEAQQDENETSECGVSSKNDLNPGDIYLGRHLVYVKLTLERVLHTLR